MKSTVPFVLMGIFILLSLRTSAQETKYTNWNGVYIEVKPDTTKLNRYTEDNKVYRNGNIYYYSYSFIDTLGNEFYYRYLPRDKENPFDRKWERVSKDSTSDSTIVSIKMEVMFGKGEMRAPNYTQSVIKYQLIPLNNHYVGFWSQTGLIENEKNIWMHPTRDDFFSILQMNPYPFIQKPYIKGNKFKWHFKIGGYWGYLIGKEWEGVVKSKCQYEITDTNSVVNTALGDLVCYKIESFAKSKIGKSYLTAYFNEKYGFVRLDYTNIDKSKIVIELSKAELKNLKP